jgi:hypothetical protein
MSHWVSPVTPLSSRTALWLLIGVCWSALTITGLALLWRYKSTPGIAASTRSWPAGTRLSLAKDRPTLVMLAHPHCPCTRASITELSSLMARAGGRIAAHVLFLNPGGVDGSWQRTDLWKSAQAIGGVDVRADLDGQEARLFDASTSGQTLLFSPAGDQLFSGGITAARGHEGDNAGLTRLLALVDNPRAGAATSPVFGCPLRDDEPADPTTHPGGKP